MAEPSAAGSLVLPRIAALILLGGALTAAPARAQDTAGTADAARRGEELYLLEEYDAALVELEKALAGGTRDGRTLYKAAYCQRATGKPIDVFRPTMAEALKALEAASQKAEGKVPFQDHFYRSAAYAGLGDTQTATKLARTTVEAAKRGEFGSIESFGSDDLLRLAQLAKDAGDVGLQQSSLTRATEAMRRDNSPRRKSLSRAYSDLAQIHLAAGRLEEARAAMVKGMDAAPPTPEGRYLYARLLYRLGDYAESSKQWRQVRNEIPARTTEAIYNMELMTTLAQKDRLLDASKPLPDLAKATRADLEQSMLDIVGQMRQSAATLPKEVMARGSPGESLDDAARKQLKTLHDQKYRLAWAAAEYSYQGHPLREFAFVNGMTAVLRAWRLKDGQPNREAGPLPEWLSAEERAKYEELMAAQQSGGKKKKGSKQAQKGSPAP